MKSHTENPARKALFTRKDIVKARTPDLVTWHAVGGRVAWRRESQSNIMRQITQHAESK